MKMHENTGMIIELHLRLPAAESKGLFHNLPDLCEGRGRVSTPWVEQFLNLDLSVKGGKLENPLQISLEIT